MLNAMAQQLDIMGGLSMQGHSSAPCATVLLDQGWWGSIPPVSLCRNGWQRSTTVWGLHFGGSIIVML